MPRSSGATTGAWCRQQTKTASGDRATGTLQRAVLAVELSSGLSRAGSRLAACLLAWHRAGFHQHVSTCWFQAQLLCRSACQDDCQ